MIELDEDLVVGDWVVPKLFLSDGCTMPPPFTWILKKILRADRFRDECILHDFLRRHIVHYDYITVKHADEIFKQLIRKKSNWLYSRIYWLGVRAGRTKYTQTKPLPRLDWKEYTSPKNDIWKRLTEGGGHE